MSTHEVWRLSRDVPACRSTPSLFSRLVEKGLALVAITICIYQSNTKWEPPLLSSNNTV